MAEDLLEKVYLLAASPQASFTQSHDALKTMIKGAGLEPKEEKVQAVGSTFAINIDLGGGNTVSMYRPGWGSWLLECKCPRAPEYPCGCAPPPRPELGWPAVWFSHQTARGRGPPSVLPACRQCRPGYRPRLATISAAQGLRDGTVGGGVGDATDRPGHHEPDLLVRIALEPYRNLRGLHQFSRDNAGDTSARQPSQLAMAKPITAGWNWR